MRLVESSNEKEVEPKEKKCLSKPAVCASAVFIGIMLVAIAIVSVYAAGEFDSSSELPEIMEGEVTFTSEDGKGEDFHVVIDFKRKLVQLSSLDIKAFPVMEESRKINGTGFTAAKTVIQDYNTGRNYFIVTDYGSSTIECVYTDIKGDMIPRHLLEHATLKSESVEGNISHIILQVDDDTHVDVYRARGRNGKIYEIYLHLPNGTMHIRSKAKELNFTDYKQLNCYKYVEENETIEEAFYQSNESKPYQLPDSSVGPGITKVLQLSLTNDKSSFSNDSQAQQLQKSARRRRRGIGWRNGWIDWWYGNWCGAKQGGYQNNPKLACKNVCRNSTSYITRACRECLPPKDALDEACMEHDRCARELKRGPWWCQPIGNPCSCDRPFVRRVSNLTQTCSTNNCRLHALQIHTVFQLLSCWYPKKTCFPWIRSTCRCTWCLCPRIKITSKCIVSKRCSFLGSGKV